MNDNTRITQLLGALFSHLQPSELSAPYAFDKAITLEQEYWAVMSLLKQQDTP